MDVAADPLQRLVELRARPRRRIIGLLSGTSADGTDAALCELEGAGETTRLVSSTFVTTPFARPLRERIFRLAQADASELTDLDVLLGEAFAEAALEVAVAAGVRIVRTLTGLPAAPARKLIEKAGGRAKVALVMHHAHVPAARARELLVAHKGSLRAIIGDVPVCPVDDDDDEVA